MAGSDTSPDKLAQGSTDTLESMFPDAARDLRQRVERGIDEEFGRIPRPFPIQSFCRHLGGKAGRFEITVSALDLKLTGRLTETSLVGLDEGWSRFSRRMADDIVERLRRQTPGITDKSPD